MADPARLHHAGLTDPHIDPPTRGPLDPTFQIRDRRSRIFAFLGKDDPLLDIDDWPLPRSLTIDQTVHDLTEHAGYFIAEDEFDGILAELPQVILAWLAAAGRYSTADYQLRLLERPIDWMRRELAPTSDQDTEQLLGYTANLHQLLDHHRRLREARATAHGEFLQACKRLKSGLLVPADRQWRDVRLVGHGLTEACTVAVPADVAPWPLVKADQRLINQLAELRIRPAPGVPALRRTQVGIARLDHDGTSRWLLPDPDHRYWLHNFAWSAPDTPHTPDQERTAGQ
ncbi:hypothetical protein ACIBSW_24910 [Actinoplanes sp. NPDC049668]|uniref:hypothetical protein n=1 Tax=unclassified Actinoplanes TaxID=2626549 RepID=UPI0033B36F93